MSIILLLHVVGGSIGLISGMFIIFLRKADQRHQILGKIFSYALGFSMLASFDISMPKKDIFLFCIGVWTLYMIVTGNRVLKLKNLEAVAKIDYFLSGTMLVFGVSLMGYGILQLISQQSMSVVSILFGLISLFLVYNDIKLYRGQTNFKNAYQLAHIQKMTGSFIAALTAFIVVNNTMLPGLIAWLLPTMVLTPLIVMWSRKWAIKV